MSLISAYRVQGQQLTKEASFGVFTAESVTILLSDLGKLSLLDQGEGVMELSTEDVSWMEEEMHCRAKYYLPEHIEAAREILRAIRRDIDPQSGQVTYFCH